MRVIVTVAAAPLLPARALPPLPPPPPPASLASLAPDQGSVCFAPFFYSGDGIKRYVLECLGPAASAQDSMIPDCTVPYNLDEAGRHHYIAACMDAVEEPCAVPFHFDDDGTKRYKSACLTD